MNGTVDIDGQTIAYRTSTGSGTPVVFVHGNSSSSATWTTLFDSEFGDKYQCLAIDLPGHGESPPATDASIYSMPGYAGLIVGFAKALALTRAVFVGWSLGGHVVLEAAPNLPEPAGLVIFGTPPIASAADMANGFLPNPAAQIGFIPDVDAAQARQYAESFLAPGSAVQPSVFEADILATHGGARAGLGASAGEGRFADEIAIVNELSVPLAILHGSGEQLVSLDYLRGLSAPTLWRGEVQVIDGAGHAPHVEQPTRFAGLLDEFVQDFG
jgi:pimeloyl-ACP methyl ester carboxylesterase